MKLSTMLCLAVASGKLFGSLWKAEDQESPARTPSLGVSEEISDLVDIETVPSPLRRMLKEAESDSTEAEDDESSNDENIDEDDEEDEDGTEDNNGFMQNRAGQLGVAGVLGVATGGGLVYCLKKGAPAKTPQGITVTVTTALDDALFTTAEGDKNVLKVSDNKRTIYTLYDGVEAFKAKYDKAVGAEAGPDHAVFALQGFEDAELTTIKEIGTAPKDSIKDRVILNETQLVAALRRVKAGGKIAVDDDETFFFDINTKEKIITRVPDTTAPAAST